LRVTAVDYLMWLYLRGVFQHNILKSVIDQLLLDQRIITRTQSQSHVSIFHNTVKLPTF
jgi:hypothetical protein